MARPAALRNAHGRPESGGQNHQPPYTARVIFNLTNFTSIDDFDIRVYHSSLELSPRASVVRRFYHSHSTDSHSEFRRVRPISLPSRTPDLPASDVGPRAKWRVLKCFSRHSCPPSRSANFFNEIANLRVRMGLKLGGESGGQLLGRELDT